MLNRRKLLLGFAAATALSGCTTSDPAPPAGLPPQQTPSASRSPRGSSSSSSAARSPAPIRQVTAADWAVGLSAPWGVDFATADTVLVSERDTGLIKRVTGGNSQTEILRVPGVAADSEAGLLGIRFDPNKRNLFVYHTTAVDNRVVRYAWTQGALGNPEVILPGIPRDRIHDGGQLAFGPDGFLYIATGDANVRSSAQDQQSLAGKILRVQPSGQPAPDNPFGNPVWSLGHRNVQGLAFTEKLLWASEFGANSQDELNLISRGGNYGWPEVEGNSASRPGMISPVAAWPTGEASPAGLAYWRGSLWMAGLRGERLWQIPVTGARVAEPVAHFQGKFGRLRSVVAFPDGSGLLVGTSNTDGRGSRRSGDDRLLRVTAA